MYGTLIQVRKVQPTSSTFFVRKVLRLTQSSCWSLRHIIAIAGLPDRRTDHAVVIAKFATDCSHRVRVLCQALEKTLGPDTGILACRIGLTSGQVLAGVLRGDNSRFQLFGDTVHKAAQIEATCVSSSCFDLVRQLHNVFANLTLPIFGRFPTKSIFPRRQLSC